MMTPEPFEQHSLCLDFSKKFVAATSVFPIVFFVDKHWSAFLEGHGTNRGIGFGGYARRVFFFSAINWQYFVR